MFDYIEMTCEDCGAHIGWRSDSGPTGFHMCDDCKDREELEETEDA